MFVPFFLPFHQHFLPDVLFFLQSTHLCAVPVLPHHLPCPWLPDLVLLPLLELLVVRVVPCCPPQLSHHLVQVVVVVNDEVVNFLIPWVKILFVPSFLARSFSFPFVLLLIFSFSLPLSFFLSFFLPSSFPLSLFLPFLFFLSLFFFPLSFLPFSYLFLFHLFHFLFSPFVFPVV